METIFSYVVEKQMKSQRENLRTDNGRAAYTYCISSRSNGILLFIFSLKSI
jgi:hypothetical protein